MSRLILRVQVQAGTASSGNAGALFVAVSVTNEAGVPTVNINPDGTDFRAIRILRTLDPRHFRALTVTEAVPTGVPGFYILTATPPTTTRDDLWEKGEYAIAFTIQLNGDAGQTIGSVLIP